MAPVRILTVNIQHFLHSPTKTIGMGEMSSGLGIRSLVYVGIACFLTKKERIALSKRATGANRSFCQETSDSPKD